MRANDSLECLTRLAVVLSVRPCLGTKCMTASLTIDASKIENVISPTLYGQFAEFMFEDIKGGLYAELIRDRGFDEAPRRARIATLLGARPGRPERRRQY